MLQTSQKNESKAIALDEAARTCGVVSVDDPFEQHLLGDLNVHA